MTFTSALAYILALILIAVTLFNLYALLTSKNKKALSKQSYSAVIAPIEKKLLSLQKERGYNFDRINRFMNDRDEGIIFVSDTKRKTAAIAMKDDLLLFSHAELEEVKKLYETKGKKVLSAKVQASIKGTVYTYTIASKPFNPRSIMGKVLYDTAEEFFEALESIKP